MIKSISKQTESLQVVLAFWRDDRAAVSPVALIFVTTIVAIGAMVGLVTVRDQVVQQFGDVAVALEALDQSYSYDLRRDAGGGGLGPNEFQMINSFTEDAPTLVDVNGLADVAGDAPACLTMTTPADPEGP